MQLQLLCAWCGDVLPCVCCRPAFALAVAFRPAEPTLCVHVWSRVVTCAARYGTGLSTTRPHACLRTCTAPHPPPWQAAEASGPPPVCAGLHRRSRRTRSLWARSCSGSSSLWWWAQPSCRLSAPPRRRMSGWHKGRAWSVWRSEWARSAGERGEASAAKGCGRPAGGLPGGWTVPLPRRNSVRAGGGR